MKIEKEKRTVEKMIRFYCKRKHKSESVCADCQKLIDYAKCRLDNCKYGNNKPACRKCSVHCYAPIMRKKIREVMRYSGPRMLFLSPLAYFKH